MRKTMAFEPGSDPLEWAVLAPGIGIIIHPHGRFSLRQPGFLRGGLPFTESRLAEPATLAGSRALLSGALWAGFGGEPDPRSAAPTLPKVIYDLCGVYHTTRATPTMFRRAAAAFARQGRAAHAAFAERKLREEAGHDQLALKDLEALGLPARRLVELIRPTTSLALVDYIEGISLREDPIGGLGYQYVLERLALGVGQTEIDAVQAVCPPGVHATRCLRVHSSVGADADHVEELLAFVAGLPAGERIDIARETYHTAAILARGRREPSPADEAVIDWIRQAGGAWPRSGIDGCADKAT
jgi:hypothetical protein